ncbi:hypothetical protein SAMN05421505_113151 [Sinosporangium album]|uniref:Uncharacterized protein n=1 Tax=Sinosporangium album TaxID=504805 RepID=A0A1G8B5U4_9ACTN|nr:hypothetical protein [Sinosporangium album]SDH28514.1 hypothetical protein SAMN05421505_113151 [Sinosporangium album]
MSMFRSYLKAQAFHEGRAQPSATVRHVHLSHAPLVFVPLRMAGEAAAPLGAMVGCDRAAPTLLVVPQPRNRELRFAFATELAAVVLPYIERFAGETETVEAKTPYERCLDAPQILVPNPRGVAFSRLLGRSTRFRRTSGPYAVPPSVPAFGQWLTFLAERAEHAGSSMFLAMTDVLAAHWVTGQSGVEDGTLAALLAWIAPPAGSTGHEAAAESEDPTRTPPAGPDTDPEFDRKVLQPAIDAYDASGSPERVEEALRRHLQPTWDLMWRAVDLLRGLPEAAGVSGRWERDRTALAREVARLGENPTPQGRWDSPVAAARRLAALEIAQQTYEAARAFDDPLAMAEYRVEGAAFAGEVVAVEADRRIVPPGGKRAVPRPLVTVRTGDPVRLAPGTRVFSPARRTQRKAEIVSVAGDTVTIQINDGMGQGREPAPGSVPSLGEVVCYTDLDPGGGRTPPLPALSDTPWTHGGPPEPYVPTDEDAQESWS